MRQRAAGIAECDFFTVETLWLRRFYVQARGERGHSRRADALTPQFPGLHVNRRPGLTHRSSANLYRIATDA